MKMERTNTILITILLLVMVGCVGNRQSGNEGDTFITVDVIANYPKKELILQDFMDVEYIPLETNDEFVCQGLVQDIGKEFIVVKNQIQDGNIFLFDRKGKGIKKINRKGQGDEEYSNIYLWGITLDEDNREIFVNDVFTRRILVYDLTGVFKRSFSHKDDARYHGIYNFDRENLICYDGSEGNKGQSFAIISKQDGSVTKEIQIPFQEKKSMWMYSRDEVNNITYGIKPENQYTIIPYFDDWLLIEPSSDTIYSYLHDHTMMPFIARTPSVQSMDPEVFLSPNIITDRYYFMESVKKEFEFGVGGFPTTDLMYDKHKKAIFKYTVHNDDYSDKRPVNMKSRPVNDEIVTWQSLEVHQLVKSYETGELKDGKLKEIAAKLDDEDNPVIMLVKHKQ